jgi:hypothetical protein
MSNVTVKWYTFQVYILYYVYEKVKEIGAQISHIFSHVWLTNTLPWTIVLRQTILGRWIENIGRRIKSAELLNQFRENWHFTFGPQVCLPLFSSRYHLCTSFYRDVVKELLIYDQNRWNRFSENHHFDFWGSPEASLFSELEYSYSLGSDLWWVNS